jgi:hypothetical protein
MIKYKKVVLGLLIGSMWVLFLVDLSGAMTISLTVPAGEMSSRKMDLAVDDHVRIQFTVVGTKSNLVFFSLVYPNGTEIDFGKVGKFTHGLVCDEEGEYTMVFVSDDMADSKLVTLNYEIEHYMFGVSQTLFLVLAIAVLCVGMVAAYVIMSPKL